MIEIFDFCIKYDEILFLNFNEGKHEIYIYLKGKIDYITIYNVDRGTYDHICRKLMEFEGDE